MENTFIPEVLLVENELPDAQRSFKGISASGVDCHVTVRQGVEEALEYLCGTQGIPPSLIVLNFLSSTAQCVDVLGRLRMNDRTWLIPVVVFGDRDAVTDLQECYQAGANSFVSGPSDPEECARRLGWIVRYWLTVNLPLRQRLLLGPAASLR
jgi:two-component system response regulator